MLLTVERVALENVGMLVLVVMDALDVERIVRLDVRGVVVHVAVDHVVPTVVTIVAPHVAVVVEGVLVFV